MRKILLVLFMTLGSLLHADGETVLHQAVEQALEPLQAQVTVQDISVELISAERGQRRADVKLVLSGPDNSVLEVSGFGIGSTDEEALEDAIGYIQRVLPVEALMLLSGPRIVHIDRMFLYLRIPDGQPAREYRSETGLLRTVGSLEGSYIPARLVYAHGSIRTGMPLEEVSRLGISLTARGGYTIRDNAAEASVEAVYDGHGGTWYPLVRLDWQMPDQLRIQAGWGITIAPRWRVDRYSLLHRTALKVYTAGGWDFSSSRVEGTAGAEFVWYIHPRASIGIYGEYRTVGGGISAGSAVSLSL